MSGLDKDAKPAAADRMPSLIAFNRSLLEDGGQYSDVTLLVDGPASIARALRLVLFSQCCRSQRSSQDLWLVCMLQVRRSARTRP